MLANADIIRTVGHTLKALLPSQPSPPSLVLDPVCVSTSGHALLDSQDEALDVLIEELLPLTTLLTPNTAEAEALLLRQRQSRRAVGETETAADSSRIKISSIEDMVRASRELCALGPRAVLVKGGHVAHGGLRIADVEAAAATIAATTKDDPRVHKITAVCEGLLQHDVNAEILFQAAAQDPAVCDVPVVVDVLCEVGDDEGGGRYTLFVRPYLDSKSTHGTGCTLGAALACALAREEPRTYFTPWRSLPLFSFLCMSCYSRRSRQFRNDVHAPRDRHCIPDGQRPWPPKPHAPTPPAHGAQARIAPLSPQPWLTQMSRCPLKLLDVIHRQADKE
jgi:hydroxymethylpyrimidine/phosphomethylpyrimidine kinase / thiaminase